MSSFLIRGDRRQTVICCPENVGKVRGCTCGRKFFCLEVRVQTIQKNVLSDEAGFGKNK